MTEDETYNMRLSAVKHDGLILEYFMQNQTPELCFAAVRQNPNALKFVRKQSEEICLAAVEQSSEFPKWEYSKYISPMRFVKKQTPLICLAAVKRNPNNLFYVRNTFEQVYIAAIEQDMDFMLHVRKQTPKICLAAVKHNGLALKFVVNKIKKNNKEIRSMAINQNELAINYQINSKKEDIKLYIDAAITLRVSRLRRLYFYLSKY